MMNELNNKNTSYTGYEYRELAVHGKHISLCLDSYPCFGWEPDPNREVSKKNGEGYSHRTISGVQENSTLYFRRSRNISNKAELTRLQRNFDSCVAELEELERAKTTQATIAALVVGILGTAFMAGATFAVVVEPPVIWLMILLAVPGFLGWIAPYFLYRTLVRKRTAEIEPLIEKKYDEINLICEKGIHLLH